MPSKSSAPFPLLLEPPAGLSGLTRWWDARDLTAGPVSSWFDRVTNDELAQSSGPLQPTATTGQTPNGQPAVVFSGSNLLDLATPGNLVLDDKSTIFFVQKIASVANCSIADASPGQPQCAQVIGSSSNKLRYIADISATSLLTAVAASWINIGWEIDHAGGDSYMFATPAAEFHFTGTNRTQTGLRLGGNNASAGEYPGAIAAALVYNRILSHAELLQLAVWATDTFGV